MAAGASPSTSSAATVNGIVAASATGDSCGYSGTSTSTTAPLNTVVFNESTTAKAIALGGNPANPTVGFFYSDEHALTLGSTSNGGVVSPFTNVYGTATNPYGDYGQKSDDTPIAGRSPLQVGDLTAKDPLHRPIYPAAFVTDITTLSGSKAGDWQNQNTPASGTNAAQTPEFIAGTWKPFQGAGVTTGDPGSGNPLAVGTKNGLGPNADNYPGLNIPGASSLEKYTAEIRWHASHMSAYDPVTNTFEPNLLSGHTYRVQVISHDGDQNKTGGDVGEACAIISLPGISTTATGGQIQPDGTATVSDTATVSGVSAPLPSGTNQVTFKVYGPDPTPGSNASDDCTAGNLVGTHNVPLNSSTPSGAYPTSFTVNASGDYHFTADLITGGVTAASSACGAANETATVTSRPTSITTDAGGPYAPTATLSDTAILSGGTTVASGTLTFTLYADNNGACGAVLGTDTKTVTNANGASYVGSVTSSPAGTFFGAGTYHWSVAYSGDSVSGQPRNEASSDGVNPCPAVDSTNPLNKENPVILPPSIDITKNPKTQTNEAAGNGELTPAAGNTPGKAAWTLVVTNNGQVALTNVVVTDPNAPNCNLNIGNLAVGASVTIQPTSCFILGLTGTSYHNVANVSGKGGAQTVTDSDFADVTLINPHIEVTKNPPSQSVALGGTAHFTIKVTNNGDVTLSSVVISDAQAQGCARTAAQTAVLIANQDGGSFDPGDNFTYTCDSDPVTAPFTNAVGACANDSLNGTVCDNDGTTGNPNSDCTSAGGNSADQCAGVGIDSLSSTQDFKPKDTGTVSFTGPHNSPNGVINFTLYKGSCVPAHKIYQDLGVAVNASGVASTASTDYLSTLIATANATPGISVPAGTDGTYNWLISYVGDTHGNADLIGACGTENFVVTNG